ncbi:MAG TPA: hypothetical protein VGR14_18520 [Verrucomicrobiae bacterium]|nr:hypothetical protein [Verrucomicrobiae bacterium]
MEFDYSSMKPFAFNVEILSLPENRQAKPGTRGYANVIAFSESMESAHKLAFNFLTKQGWKPISVELAFEILGGPPHDDPELKRVYDQAKIDGVAAEYAIVGRERLGLGQNSSRN